MPVAREQSSERKLVPQGVHLAVCDMIVDLGLQRTNWQGQEKVTHQVFIRWQIPEERRQWEFDGEKHEGPAVIGATFTLSLGKKSKLRPLLESWRGKAFTADELRGFDVAAVLGVSCQLNVLHEESADGSKVYANVKTVLPLPKGMPKIVPEGELICYEQDSPFEMRSRLPQWIKEKLDKAVLPEEKLPTEFPDEVAGANGDPNDDIPF